MKRKNNNMDVHYSSKTNEWGTPPEVFKQLNDIHHFTLDPCCNKQFAKCNLFYTKEDDGLSKDWGKHVVFMNPPYARNEQVKWLKKAYESSLIGAKVVCLVPARTDTAMWHDYCMKGDIQFIRRRIAFVSGMKAKDSCAPFPSAIVIFNRYGKNVCSIGSISFRD